MAWSVDGIKNRNIENNHFITGIHAISLISHKEKRAAAIIGRGTFYDLLLG